MAVLQWARAQQPPCPWDWGACHAAAAGGHLHVLQWVAYSEAIGDEFVENFDHVMGERVGKRAGDGLGVGFLDGRSLLFGGGDGFVVNLAVDHLTAKGVLQMIAMFLFELDGAVEGAEDPQGPVLL
jgi:hypothetical protein